MSTVIVASALTNKAKRFLDANVPTWGDVREMLGSLYTKDLEAVIRPGNFIPKDDTTPMPTGDFNVYLVVKKNEGGMSGTDAYSLGKEIADAIVTAAAKSSKEQMEELKDALIEEIEDFFEIHLDEPEESLPEDEDCGECDKAMEELRTITPNS